MAEINQNLRAARLPIPDNNTISQTLKFVYIGAKAKTTSLPGGFIANPILCLL